ncbi:replication fork protection component Swi3-domain-containing protein [Phycomyces nitens]|nr:replication fork protection component Swi3-domain-containing protein [Phycomyces nitens]
MNDDLNDSFYDLLGDLDPFGKTTGETSQNTSSTFDPLAARGNKRAGEEEEPVRAKRHFKKLDADLMLSDKGLPRIRHEAPWLRFKGRGYEDLDLARLMEFYHIWADNLFPRLAFSDFSHSVLKATANARCQTVLSTWQDEFESKRDRVHQEDNGQAQAGELSGMTVEDEENERRASSSTTHVPRPTRSPVLPPHETTTESSPTLNTTPTRSHINNAFAATPINQDDSSDDEEPLFQFPKSSPNPIVAPPKPKEHTPKVPDPAKANRAAALAKLAARKREQERQRMASMRHDDSEDEDEEDPGAEYINDM